MEQRGPSAYLAELIGTFVLVLFIGIILASNSAAGLGFTDFAVIGLLHAFVLAMLIATLGGTSGGHFNPAVTTTLAALRKITVVDAAIYIVMQLVGGVLAALVVKLMITDPADATNYGATAINHKFLSGNGAAFLAEAIGTFALVWAIVGTEVNPRGDRNWAPWIIGITLGFAVMAIGPLTGAGLNPARSFGPGLVGDFADGFGTFLLVYTLAPVVGGLVAGLIYQYLVINPQAFEGERPVDKYDDIPPAERPARGDAPA
jgi:MIP family channel proteins